jgi:ferredoxin-thioredoxin reductase catalytic subunit
VRDEGRELLKNVHPVYCGKRPTDNDLRQKNACFCRIFALARPSTRGVCSAVTL